MRMNINSLTRSNEHECYEYLGDAVIELVMSRILFDRFPEITEGELSRLRAATVNEGQLAIIAKEINLGNFLYLGKGEEATNGREKPSLLSDAFEAVCGAIYLDRGFDKAVKALSKLFSSVLERAGDADFMCDHKTKLQEEVQAKYKIMPRYQLIKTSGPDHCKKFEVVLYVGERRIGGGVGGTKKVLSKLQQKKA